MNSFVIVVGIFNFLVFFNFCFLFAAALVPEFSNAFALKVLFTFENTIQRIKTSLEGDSEAAVGVSGA